MDTNQKDEWFAVRVRLTFEHAVFETLMSKGYDAYLPTYEEQRPWAQGTKNCELPLFSGYLFCRTSPERCLEIVQIAGVRDVVSFGRTPVGIPGREIEAVRRLAQSRLKVEPHPYSPVGPVVRIEKGPLAGTEGILHEFCGACKFLVSISLLQKTVAADWDAAWVDTVPAQ
jgi:transcription antitermination factor NusG